MNPYKPSLGDRFWKFSSVPFSDAHDLQQYFEDAAMTGRLWRVHFLITEKNVDVGGREHFAMRWAANGNLAEMIRLLASFGGDPNAKGGEPLVRAVTRGHLEAAAALLETGAKLSARNFEALKMAAHGQDQDMLKLFLSTSQPILPVVEELHKAAVKQRQEALVSLFGDYIRRHGGSAPPAPKP